MSNILQVFSYNSNAIRILIREKNPWWVAKDVCDVLEIKNSRQALTRLDDDEKDTVIINDGTPGNPAMAVINEPGLYTLVLSSRKPEAREFKRWITHEVIPSIRKHGMYATSEMIDQMLADPETMIRTLKALQEERQQRKALEEKIAIDSPYTNLGKGISNNDNDILMRDMAKILTQNGINIGQNRLFEWMRDNGYVIKYGNSRNTPTQYASERGWLRLVEREVPLGDGRVKLYKSSVVTGKGQVYFLNRFLREMKEAQ